MNDELYIQECIDLARRALGRTSPNPLVGALVVSDDGTVIAEGYHAQAGQAHAEVEALDKAGDAARGATLYVNLEPCCHYGKTPPCSRRVIKSGVKRVVCGMLDPNPEVGGNGFKEIQEAGIEIVAGVLESECRYLNRFFLKRIKERKPWLALKMAATLDGRIADRKGSSRWITGADARTFVHQLRNEFDSILIGSNTANTDDPELTVRMDTSFRDPYRIVVDSRLSVSPQSKLCKNADGKTIIFCSADAFAKRAKSFPDSINIVAIAEHKHGLDLSAAFDYLFAKNINSILCEGGARLAASLLAARSVDELYWLIAPKLLLDEEARPVLAWPDERLLGAALELPNMDIRQLGDDLLVHSLLNTP